MSSENKSSLTDQELQIFNSIKDFLQDTKNAFDTGKSPFNFTLYVRLINKTFPENIKAIQQHITLFTKLFSDHPQAFTTQDVYKFVSPPIVMYSDKIYFNVQELLAIITDLSSRKTIWHHLLYIRSLIFPQTKGDLENYSKTIQSEEAKLIAEIASKVQAAADPNEKNPMAVVGNLLTSGEFNGLITGLSDKIKSGNVNVKELLNVAQKMIN